MLEAKELRIGNLVTIDNPNSWSELKDLPMMVTEIKDVLHRDFPKSNSSITVSETKKYGRNFSQLNEFILPIPISEEWLMRFGFEKDNLDPDNGWLKLQYRFLCFASDDSVKFEQVYLMINKMDVVCNYVHQLQNLYFALTGKELELKQ